MGRTRSSHAEAILGPDLYSKLGETRVLVVGAGGIGCELLKNIVMAGFGHITLLDLDTIDLSNLNRQFLFRKKDVKQSKALVAAKTAATFNPSVKIYPIHANIKEPEYDLDWFGGFDIVLNALDNLEARRHVNKLCLAANVPLVESGTAGYFGQVQPILRDYTECFDCMPKETPKTFPVCTIRSTPSLPIHCIVWAKSYLLPQLFGEEDSDNGADTELDSALNGENASEISSLRAQAQAFSALRSALRSQQDGIEELARSAFQKVFKSDIETLLGMKDMWANRRAPVVLDWDRIRGEEHNHVNGASANGAGEKLQDQKELTISDCLEMFVSSVIRLAERSREQNDTGDNGGISFDKDDPDTLDFVTAAANLRAYGYHIPNKTKWEIKEMAGNIIPAIATTNAIIAGLIVLQALHLLRRSSPSSPPNKTLRNVNIQSKPSAPLAATRIIPPSTACPVCRDTYTYIRCDPTRTTLGEVKDGFLEGEERDVTVFEKNRLLADPDFDDNLDKTLTELGVGRGDWLTIVDDEKEWSTLSVAILPLPPNHPSGEGQLVLPSPLPTLRRLAPTLKRARSPTPPVAIPRTPSKRKKLANGSPVKKLPHSPSKRERLENDGLVIMEADDDVIIIDDD